MRLAKNFYLFHTNFYKLNNTGARMLDSIYHRTLKLLSNCILDVTLSRFCYISSNIIMDVNVLRN